jgi:hypothetical protein
MMVSSDFAIRAKFWSFCRDSWNLSSTTPIVPTDVFGWGKRLHGIHHRWILVMVPLDVTNFDDGHWRRDVIGFYVNIFPLTT